MTIVGILALHLAGPCRQQVLQGPKTVLDPVAPLPRLDEPRPADGRVQTHHVELLLPSGSLRRTDVQKLVSSISTRALRHYLCITLLLFSISISLSKSSCYFFQRVFPFSHDAEPAHQGEDRQA